MLLEGGRASQFLNFRTRTIEIFLSEDEEKTLKFSQDKCILTFLAWHIVTCSMSAFSVGICRKLDYFARKDYLLKQNIQS